MADRAEAGQGGRRPAKSAAAFRTISEVAGELDVPAHVLRFWESKFAQVKPLKRGGGRRYYRPEDVDLLRAIRTLLYTDGYTIKGVQRLLREGGVKSLPQGSSRVEPEERVARAPASPDREPGRRGDAAGDRREGEIESILNELESLRRALREDI